MRATKILVVGAGEAGKSTLINALSPEAMNLQVDGRTVAMDHAMLVLGEHRVSLVGVPGQKRFSPVRDALARGSGGAIWVHRAGDAIDRETAGLVTELAESGAGYVVYVNHHNGHRIRERWSPPAGCVQPRAVITGNLTDPGDSLSMLRGELEQLVRMPRKERDRCLPHLSR